MASHPTPRKRLTPRWLRTAVRWVKDHMPDTQYHRRHPAFMVYLYATLAVMGWVTWWVTTTIII